MCDATGPDTGAIISLNAIGKQDKYLLNPDPEHSLFKYELKKHASFRKFHKRPPELFEVNRIFPAILNL